MRSLKKTAKSLRKGNAMVSTETIQDADTPTENFAPARSEGRPAETTARAVVSSQDLDTHEETITPLVSQAEAAQMAGVSIDTVQRAKAVLEKGSADLKRAVESKEVSIKKARPPLLRGGSNQHSEGVPIGQQPRCVCSASLRVFNATR